jgi:methylated-DNA-[protein]-cysteine S-methyltransferase
MELLRVILSTPVGPMLALASEQSLCALEFDTGSRRSRLEARLANFYDSPSITAGSNDVHTRTRDWLERYFAGDSADVRSLSLDARGTPFETSVWTALLTIPTGATTSYGAVAEQVTGTPAASRAVGLANGANPIAIIVPCHRVIGSSGTLTGYGGGLDRKLWLLEHEERWWPSDRSLSRVSRGSRQPRLEFSA